MHARIWPYKYKVFFSYSVGQLSACQLINVQYPIWLYVRLAVYSPIISLVFLLLEFCH